MRKCFYCLVFLGLLVYLLLLSWYLSDYLIGKWLKSVPINVKHRSNTGGIVRLGSRAHRDSQWPSCRIPIFLVIVVLSAPKNHVRRTAIRETWARMPQNGSLSFQYLGEEMYNGTRLVKTVFLLGQVQNEALSQSIRTEAKYYGDIVIGSFIDSYQNLTLKVKVGFTWAYLQCNFKYLMKTDDDSFVNTNGLVKWLWNSPKKDFYTGKCYFGKAVVRKTGHKW